MNSVALIGRLTADPTTHAGDNHESATFRLAIPRNGSDGADFIDVVCFDKLAAVCAEYLAKGRDHNGATSKAAGLVAVMEPGRALDTDDIAAVVGLPVITTIPLRADIARAVDAGVLADRLPEPLATAAARILAVVMAQTARKVA